MRVGGIVMNEDRLLLHSMLTACRDMYRLHLPIQKLLLQSILEGTKHKFLSMDQPYLALLYQTIFCVSYYGLFRVGEVAVGNHPVRVTDVHLAENKPKWLFVLRSSKTHGHDSKAQTVKICQGNSQ